MITRIEREIKRDGLTADIKDSILTSIAHYESRRLDFNEDDATAQAGTGSESLSFPTNFLEVDRLEASSSATDRYDLMVEGFDAIRDSVRDADGNSVPDKYAYYQDRFYFDAKLDKVYEFRAWGLRKLSEISASSTTTDTNAWMTTGEALVRSEAKSRIFRHVLRNTDEALTMEREAVKELAELKRKATKKASTNKVQKTYF